VQVGLVVHPRREVDSALDAVREWASRLDLALGQVPVYGKTRPVGEPVEVASCDVVIALGGDGTTLAALHAAAPASRPVLAVACGSIGVLTAVPADRLPSALERVSAGDWGPRPLPGLEIAAGTDDPVVAINDFAVIRDGTGQVIAEIRVDGELYARTAGDGVVVGTQVGSSAYTMAAGGPILAPGAQGMVVTPLAQHGAVAPPLVVGPDSRVELAVEPGYGGCRFEVDGQELVAPALEASLRLRPGYATLVALADQEPMLAGLRRRGLVTDAARVLARDAREARDAARRATE
jgi:NAD+ kinase